MWQLALVLFVLQRYGSPSLAGISVFLAIAPGVIVSPLAGALLTASAGFGSWSRITSPPPSR